MEKKPITRDERPMPFGEKEIGDVLKALDTYKSGKASIDSKATDNQQWWRLRHWQVINSSSDTKKDDVETGSAWAVNSILNKHADIMDSYPKPNVLPRAADDEEEAEMLSKILPAIEEHNHSEEVYSSAGYDFLIDGTAVTAVMWDQSKCNGLGDIAKTNVDIHNVFWEPGVEDIQDSKYFFHVTPRKVEDVRAMYPEHADMIQPSPNGIVTEYIHDDSIDTTQNCEVIECYYKKTVGDRVAVDVGNGQSVVTIIPRTVLHLAIIIGRTLVFCSENEPAYENEGFYHHGKYPFVFRKLFPVKDSPCGFGYLDIMKHPQRDIDKMDQAMIRNVMMKAKPRWWVKKNADIDKKKFANWDEELIEVGSGDLGNAVKQMDVDNIPSFYLNHMANKVEELKETSGNRDFSQGATAQGVTAASAIAALQEAGSKLSRDVNKAMYRGSREEYELMIELIRQFYTEARTFRVDDGKGGVAYVPYTSENIRADQPGHHSQSIFDVSISAEKSSPFSRAAQNETAKELYNLGLFAPGNAQPALICIEMMEFEGKEKIRQMIIDSDTQMQQFTQMAQFITQNAPAVAMQMGLIDPQQVQNQMAGPNVQMERGTPEERASEHGVENTRVARAREAARSRSEV